MKREYVKPSIEIILLELTDSINITESVPGQPGVPDAGGDITDGGDGWFSGGSDGMDW